MRICPDFCRLITDTDCAYGVGDGIQRENGRQRPVDVFFKCLQASAELSAFLQLNLSIGWRDTE